MSHGEASSGRVEHRRGFAGPDSPVEELAAAIAHELATPLSIIETAVQTVLSNDGRSAGLGDREILEMIQRNAHLALLLSRRMARVGAFDLDAVDLDLMQVDLAKLVRETVEDLRQVMLADNPVTVTVTSSPVIAADPAAVQEIVANLLSNACKYSDESARIEVVVRTAGPMAELVVRDHGLGVPPEDADAIFERFYRGETDAPGAGLGLSISRGLARAHGGDLTVTSTGSDGDGSQFLLMLPLGD